jgi:hypothetical protein
MKKVILNCTTHFFFGIEDTTWGGPHMPECFGIDIGYGFTKTYDGESFHLFRTAVSAMPAKPSSPDASVVFVNGNRYLVGKGAEKGMLQTMASGFVTSKPWLAVLGHALKLNDFRTGRIVLGVPPGFYTRDYERAIVDSIKNSNLTVDGVRLKFSSDDDITVIPQGVGVYYSQIINHPEDKDKKIIIFDIGYHMMATVMFSQGHYIERVAESSMFGISEMLDKIKKTYFREYMIQICDDDAVEAFVGRKDVCLEHGLPPIDIDPRFYLEPLEWAIRSRIHRLGAGLDMIIMGGGASIMLRGMLDIGYAFQLVDRPQYANAIGYWCYAKNGSKQPGNEVHIGRDLTL